MPEASAASEIVSPEARRTTRRSSAFFLPLPAMRPRVRPHSLPPQRGRPLQWAHPAPHRSRGAAMPARVLLVEDNEDAGDILLLCLQDLGHDVRLARDGVEALGLVGSGFSPDLVV